MTSGPIRIGIGGWTYTPWRGTFFPEKWPHKRELEYAASKLTAIEVNGTYYSSQKPATFASWANQVPDGFVFALKASRFCTNRKVLAEAGESIARFVGQGIVELGDRLGPILWQFMATKKFEPQDFGAFLKLLPASQDGVALRHAMQVRHDSFRVPEFIAMARAAGVAIVYADSPEYPAIADVTGDFVYARLEAGVSMKNRPVMLRGISIAGQMRPSCGPRAGCHPGCPMRAIPHRRRRVRRSCSSSTAARCARRMRRWR